MKILKVFASAFLLGFSSLLFAAVNLNTATEAELAGLDGVGEAKAAAIIKHREDNGPFESVDDFTQVTGVGDSTLEKNRDNLTVEAKKK